jgi:hypothetical protein
VPDGRLVKVTVAVTIFSLCAYGQAYHGGVPRRQPGHAQRELPDKKGELPELPSQKTRLIIVVSFSGGLSRMLALAVLDKGGII